MTELHILHGNNPSGYTEPHNFLSGSGSNACSRNTPSHCISDSRSDTGWDRWLSFCVNAVSLDKRHMPIQAFQCRSARAERSLLHCKLDWTSWSAGPDGLKMAPNWHVYMIQWYSRKVFSVGKLVNRNVSEEQTASILRIGMIHEWEVYVLPPSWKIRLPPLPMAKHLLYAGCATIRSNKIQCNAFRKYNKCVYNIVKETHPRNKIH